MASLPGPVSLAQRELALGGMAIRRPAPTPEDDRCGAWGHRTCDCRAYTLGGSGGAALSVGTTQIAHRTLILRSLPFTSSRQVFVPLTYLVLLVHPSTRSGRCLLADGLFFDCSQRDLDGVLDVACARKIIEHPSNRCARLPGSAHGIGLVRFGSRKLRPNSGGRFGPIPGEMIPERVNKAKREARPDRRSEIERHPGNLILPLSKITRHYPTSTHVTETLERPQELAAIRQPSLPSAQVHWYVDGHEKSQIAHNPGDADDKGNADWALEFR